MRRRQANEESSKRGEDKGLRNHRASLLLRFLIGFSLFVSLGFFMFSHDLHARVDNNLRAGAEERSSLQVQSEATPRKEQAIKIQKEEEEQAEEEDELDLEEGMSISHTISIWC